MKERAILFSGPMVRAILDGRKTVTRRVMRTNHVGYSAFYRWDGEPFRRAMMRCLNETKPGSSVFCESNRFGVPGDRLWVRETWCYAHPDYHDEAEGRRKGDRPVREYPAPWWCHYAATDDVDEPKWRPSILMPRWASRITLEIVDVRVERLHEIDEADAEREGCATCARGLRSCSTWTCRVSLGTGATRTASRRASEPSTVDRERPR